MSAAWVESDGGRAAAGFKGEAGDCVVRAVAIATGQPYRDVYDELHRRAKHYLDTTRSTRARLTRNGNKRSASPRAGVPPKVYRALLQEMGWEWVCCKRIGDPTTTHLRADELPPGRIIAEVSKHLVACIDGVPHDTEDPSREGTRMVYGYWRPKAGQRASERERSNAR